MLTPTPSTLGPEDLIPRPTPEPSSTSSDVGGGTESVENGEKCLEARLKIHGQMIASALTAAAAAGWCVLREERINPRVPGDQRRGGAVRVKARTEDGRSIFSTCY